VRILLVNPPTGEKLVIRDMMGGVGFNGGRGVLLPPIDLALLAASLEAHGAAVGIYDANVAVADPDPVRRYIEPYRADIIIANVSLPSLDSDIRFLQQLREKHRGPLIAKTGVTYEPILYDLLRDTSVDFAIVGECETSIHEVLAGRETAATVAIDDGCLVFGEKKLLADLDALPVPARHLLENKKYTYSLLGAETTTMQTSRGCVFPCAYYCPYPLVQGRKYRARSPRHVVEEIHEIVHTHMIRRILFRDAVFTLDMDRTREICESILQRRLGFEWWCETRINCLDPTLLKLMEQAGCKGINIGVETGDPQVLASEAKAGVSLDQIRNTYAECRRLGIKLHFLLMVGLPSETPASVYQTYCLLRELKPDSIGITYITPYPGTPLFFEAKKRGWIATEDWSRYGSEQPVMRTDNLSTAQLVEARNLLCQGFHYTQTPTWKNRLLGRRLEHRFQKWAFRDK
jgi:radical SAM superfamily enzyme YgiQ (UPF0313 family)